MSEENTNVEAPVENPATDGVAEEATEDEVAE